MKDWSQIKRAVTPVELEAAIADLQFDDPDLREAHADLIREGRLVDSGRRRNGRIVWILAERLSHRCATDDHLPEVFEIRSDCVYTIVSALYVTTLPLCLKVTTRTM